MTIKVTFDSNVWRRVASPTKFSGDPDIGSYTKIHDACKSGEITGYVSETTLTLEQVKRTERLQWLTSPPTQTATEEPTPDGGIHLINGIGPNTSVKPAAVQMVKDHLADAYNLGIRFLRSKRIAGPSNPLLNDTKYFLNYADSAEFHFYNNKNGEIARQLEAKGLGIGHLKKLGENNRNSNNSTWFKGLKNLNSRDKARVPDLVAEWADVDAVSTSIAHNVSYFCTNDTAKGASGKGVNSILSPTNSQTIKSDYGLQFITPSELASLIGN